MSAQIDALREIADAMLNDDAIYNGLDPILVAHLKERVEADPSLRSTLAVAALYRAEAR